MGPAAMSEPVKVWAAVAPNGVVVHDTIAPWKAKAQSYLDLVGKMPECGNGYGYTLQRFILTPDDRKATADE